MNCENCNIVINSSFTYAIKTNACPACGKNIISAENLGSYLRLRELLESNFKSLDVDSIANLVIANFDIKQKFRTSDVETTDDPDKEFKEKQRQEAKEILQKRQTVYEEALRESWGMDSDSGILIGEDMSHDEQRTRAKQQESYNNVISGSKGSFHRSG